MRTYAAYAGGNKYHAPLLNAVKYPWVLISYAYDKGGSRLSNLTYEPGVMLDSGAFSVKTVGKEIKLSEYVKWALAYASSHPHVRVTNLDVIGDPHATRKERNRAVKQSRANADVIRGAGLRVIEVHHLFDPIESFEVMLGRRREGEVIGVAGLGGGKEGKDLGRALGSAVFARLRDHFGWGNLPPVHGFGVSANHVAFLYPLSSIDASTWVAPHRYGQGIEQGKLVVSERYSKMLKHEDACIAYGRRMLSDWVRREASLEKFWRDRGVFIQEEGPAFFDAVPA